MCFDKDPEIFFEVAEAVCKKRSAVEFIWIGGFWNDEAGKAARKLFEESKFRDRIKVTGWLENPLAEMADADLFCMFSLGESFCYVVADAIALNIPILVRNVMGLKDLAQYGKTGCLTEGNSSEIVPLIMDAMDNNSVWKARAGFAKSWLFSTYSLSQSVKEVYELYTAVSNAQANRVT